MATRKPALQVDAGAFAQADSAGMAPRKLNTQTGQISEYVDGEWRDTGLRQDVSVGESKLASFGAGAAQVLSAPARLFQSAAGVRPDVEADAGLYQSHYGQNPVSMFAGQLAGSIPGMVGGSVLGAGASLAANAGIQGAIGALSNAEDPLTNALWAAALVGGVGLLPKVRGVASRAMGRGGTPAMAPGSPGDPAGLPGVSSPSVSVPGRGAGIRQVEQQAQGQYYGGNAPPGTQPGLPGGGLLPDNPATGISAVTEIGAGGGLTRMDPAQLATARSMGLYVDPASEFGSQALRRVQMNRLMDPVMDIGREQNQRLLTEAAGRAAGIEGRTVNAFTLEDAMQRTRNGFNTLAGEAKPVPKAQLMEAISEVLQDPIAHGPLIRRFDRAPEIMDGRQLGAMQSFLAKERFKYSKQGDLNMVDAFDAAHTTVLDTIERQLPAGSRGNMARLRQEYQGQMVLERPGVMGAGDTVNASSYYAKLRREGRASPDLQRARKLAQLMHTMRDTLGNSGTAGRSGPLIGAGAGGTVGALIGGGPVGAALGGMLGAGAARMAPPTLFQAYNRAAPGLMGLMARGG
jgi:hypothetical protein